MGSHVRKSGSLEFHYGYRERTREYWYMVVDKNMKHVYRDGVMEFQSTATTGMSLIVMAEKLKQFEAPQEHIQKILLMRKI
jgi:hypothetical protein